MKIAILGAGNVGATLGGRWSERGHSVTYGARNPSAPKYVELLAQQKNVRVTTLETAASTAEVVVIATPWLATEEAIHRAGDLSGKVVIDCTNPILSDFSGIEIRETLSAGERVALWAHGAEVVKAFNTMGFNVMRNPHFGTEVATMFICGDSQHAKKVVAELSRELDFDAIDCGPLSQSRYLEAAAWLWITMALKYGQGREIAFRLLHR